MKKIIIIFTLLLTFSCGTKYSKNDDYYQSQINDLKIEIKDLNDKIKTMNNKEYGRHSDKLFILNGYEINQYKLSKNQINQLKNEVDYINKRYKNSSLEIYGFTDDTGSYKYNLELGYKRARSVYDELVKLGIDKSIVVIKVVSNGVNQINDTNLTNEGRFNNRRVEIKIID